MSAPKYEFQTLVQDLTGTQTDYFDVNEDVSPIQTPHVVLADKNLAAHINDGWEIVPDLSGVIDGFSFDGMSGGGYPKRIVTLRRPIPSKSDLYGKAVRRFEYLARKHMTDEIGVVNFIDYRLSFPPNPALYIERLDSLADTMPEAVLTAYQALKDARADFLEELDASREAGEV